MKLKSNIFWGIVIIGIGIVVLLNMLGIHFYFASRFMHLIIGSLLVLYGVSGIVQKRYNFMTFFALYVGIGFMLFASIAQIGFLWRLRIDSPWAFIGPAAILAVGTSMIMKSSSQAKDKTMQYTKVNPTFEQSQNKFTDSATRLNIQDLFGSSVMVATSQHFQGGTISSRFSETVIDLRQVKADSGIVLEMDSLFSSIKIIVSKDMYVNVNRQTNLFSSVDKNKDVEFVEGMQQISVNVSAVFGSVEIEYA